MFKIWNEDCLLGCSKIETGSIDLGIYDPPFGIGESEFDKLHYKRNSENVIPGYKEAPDNYEEWTYLWLKEAKRILKKDGSMYVVMCNGNLRHLLNAADKLGLKEVNHIIWKFNFGLFTTKKYTTSHYHVLYYARSDKSKVTFNTHCRFGQQEKDHRGKSLLYQDLQDVFVIDKEYAPGEMKNQNKLPEELIQKLILYSSNKHDLVCDFFMGNFTTAYVAKKLARGVCGFEINKNSYDYHMEKLRHVEYGSSLESLKSVVNIKPENQGKPISQEESDSIYKDYLRMVSSGMKKKDVSEMLQEKYKRGKFSIKNILDAKNIENGKLALSLGESEIDSTD